ncbi:uncharacterized protein LOC134292166 [Aedes albopictus]|uniref:CCHC-type domain-containing protein n=1 Tax=Aedes albopictus TaxID=7160 RepID=A0ABM2A428_AEDAL
MSEAIVINLTASKLDPSSRKAWESSVKRGKLPVYKEMIAILKNQLAILERCERAKPQTKPKGSNSTTKYSSMSGVCKSHTAIVNKSEEGCALCHANHSVEHCDAFKKLNANARYGKARQFGLCFLCLKRGHRTNDCKTVRKCTACSRNHHSLLHPEEHKESQTPKGVVETTPDVKTIDKPAAKDVSPSTNCQVSCNNNEVQQQVLLATAVAYVIDASGQRHVCRALLDSGAMASFMSQHLADLLDLRKETADVPVVGVTGMRTTVKFKVRARVESCSSNYAFYQDYLIVPRVTGALPTNPVEADRWPIPQDLYLADSRFYEPNRVDLLIGAEIFFELLLQGKIKMADELPVLQESVFGWLVSGRVIESTASNVQVYHVAKDEPSDKELVKVLKRFWSVDDQKLEVLDRAEEDDCERHFVQTYQRISSGRFIVRLPFRNNVSELGETRQQAEKRLQSLQRRFIKDPELKQAYKAFIDEYVALGHARIVDDTTDADGYTYYLPHHCVLKPDSSSTKLRVVFDASAKSSTNLSLNDVMIAGPTVQPQLFDIMLRFRFVKYAFTTDVSKMYRQVKVHDGDCRYQRILWYDSQGKPIVIELTTVTYGTSAAPFLATRCLNQLAVDEQNNFPEASEKVLKCFYVDDALTGANELEEARQLQSDLISLLSKGGFDLHKWCANDAALLSDIPPERREKQVDFENHDVNEVIKTLGLLWNPVEDELVFRVQLPEKPKDGLTKRQILSEVARLFDPLGLLGPAIVIAKIVMQELWKQGFNWDDPVSGDVLNNKIGRATREHVFTG